ncbi:hypothetical protein TELCIR_17072, partial [Teladorsagia circumcincta]
NVKKSGEMSFPTQFILSTCMLANILSVKDSAVDDPFELKVDNVRFAGHPKKLLSKKLALAIDSLQTQRGYFAEQERAMRSALDEFEAEVSSRPESDQSLLEIPWETIRRKSALAELLTKVYLDVGRTGVVQVFLIVRHLLLWARAVVIYPLCNTNVYASATYPKPWRRYISLFSQQFGSSFHLADALAQFDPPSTLGEYLNSRQPLADQQNKAKVIVALLRHQLIMQLHRFCYIVPPFSDAKLPRAGHHCPDSLKASENSIAGCRTLGEEFKPIVSDLCGSMLNTQSFCHVERKLHLFLRMSAYMHGLHHIEDMVYRLNVCSVKIVQRTLEMANELATPIRHCHQSGQTCRKSEG